MFLPLFETPSTKQKYVLYDSLKMFLLTLPLTGLENKIMKNANVLSLSVSSIKKPVT